MLLAITWSKRMTDWKEISQNLIVQAIVAAKKAGEAILEVYFSDFNVKLKDDLSPLTMADKNSHDIILRHLRNPNIGGDNDKLPILSEEGKDIPYDERRKWEYFWLIDPLDGTKEFIKRNGEFTVNIALIHRNMPVLGVIYAPVNDLFYFAAKGFGAFKLSGNVVIDLIRSNERIYDKKRKLIHVIFDHSLRLMPDQTVNKTAARLTVVGSRSHATKEFEDFVKSAKLKHEEMNFISAGSSLKFCLVAEGSADIYPRFGPTMEWDTAAGQIIVEESGGKVLSMETGMSLFYNKDNLLNPWFIVAKDMESLKIS